MNGVIGRNALLNANEQEQGPVRRDLIARVVFAKEEIVQSNVNQSDLIAGKRKLILLLPI